MLAPRWMGSGKVIRPVAADLLTREAMVILVWGVAKASNTEQNIARSVSSVMLAMVAL